MVILPKISAELRALLGFFWEIATTSKLEAAHYIAMALVAADVNKFLQNLLPAFLQSKKAFSQTVSILSENVLYCFEKPHEMEQIATRWLSTRKSAKWTRSYLEQRVNSQKRVEFGGLSPTASSH